MSQHNSRKNVEYAVQEPRYNVFIAHNYDLFIKNQENANSNDLRIKRLIERNKTVSRRHQRKQLSEDRRAEDVRSQFIAPNSYKTSTVISKQAQAKNPQLLMKRLDYLNQKNDNNIVDDSSFLNGDLKEQSISVRAE